MPPPTSFLYLTSARSGSMPVVSQSIMKPMVPVGGRAARGRRNTAESAEDGRGAAGQGNRGAGADSGRLAREWEGGAGDRGRGGGVDEHGAGGGECGGDHDAEKRERKLPRRD